MKWILLTASFFKVTEPTLGYVRDKLGYVSFLGYRDILLAPPHL